jgi:hypothetical protein
LLIRSRSIVTCGVLGGCSGLYAHWQLEETLLVQAAAAPATNSAAGEDGSAEDSYRPDVLTFSRLCMHVKNSFKVLDLMSATESLCVAKGIAASLLFSLCFFSKHIFIVLHHRRLLRNALFCISMALAGTGAVWGWWLEYKFDFSASEMGLTYLLGILSAIAVMKINSTLWVPRFG